MLECGDGGDVHTEVVNLIVRWGWRQTDTALVHLSSAVDGWSREGLDVRKDMMTAFRAAD